uniref:Uncharacterized protein n=1 Tax=Emiliania huxleyi TaxID=2903 RepID=A0A7S3SC26_EMIHU
MRSVHVLSFRGMTAFDDACMEALVRLLQGRPQVFSLNMGEKPNVSLKGWKCLAAHLWVGHIVCLFIDKINCKEIVIRECLDAIAGTRRRKDGTVRSRAGRREVLETEASELVRQADKAKQPREVKPLLRKAARLVPWRTGKTMALARSHGQSVEHWFAKPWWHPKKSWPALQDL